MTPTAQNTSSATLVDGPSAWLRLALCIAAATVINIGMWAAILVLPNIQADYGVDRASLSQVDQHEADAVGIRRSRSADADHRPTTIGQLPGDIQPQIPRGADYDGGSLGHRASIPWCVGRPLFEFRMAKTLWRRHREAQWRWRDRSTQPGMVPGIAQRWRDG